MDMKVPGMSCTPCSRAVTNAVRSVDPTANVDIDLATKRVAIETVADEARIRAAIEEAGYKVDTAAA